MSRLSHSTRTLLRSAAFVAGMAALAWVTHFAGTGSPDLDPSRLGASPTGARPDFEIVVTLRTDEVQTFEYRIPVDRTEVNDLRFDARGPRDEAVKKARHELARRHGYGSGVYGAGADQIERARVIDVALLDHRQSTRVSILRQNAI